MSKPRRWTLEGARLVLGEVRERTERAVLEAHALLEERDATRENTSERAALEAGVQEVVERWARHMEALGAEVKGLWLVDFDNGNGYYCWRWPEPELGYFHGYEDGFSGRTRIQ
jgi:hypothetical protein